MEDKLSKVRAEIERRYNEYMAKDSELAAIRADECLGILSYIDSMQEECNITGIKSRHATGKLKECIDNQTEERLEQTRKQLEENSQECMYARDNYTDEDRKVLCDGCEEECEYAQKEADWLQELQDKLDSLSKEDFDKVWAKYHQKEEPVSEDLGEYINELSKQFPEVSFAKLSRVAVRVAKWQKQQMMTKAVEVEISDNGCTKGLQFIPVWPFTDEYVGGDKVKVIIIKEE